MGVRGKESDLSWGCFVIVVRYAGMTCLMLLVSFFSIDRTRLFGPPSAIEDGLSIALVGIPLILMVAFDLYRARRYSIRERRALNSQCINCGYDLRATPDRCPECGTVPTAQPARPGGAGG